MAIDQKRRQKQLARKAAKRKRVLTEKKASQGRMDITSLRKLMGLASISPIHECFVPKGIFDLGLGYVIISRKMPDGTVAASVFLLDVFCLGVKDCFFTVVSKSEYEHRIAHLGQNEGLQRVEPEYAVKLVENAVAYAKNLGIDPHKDYHWVSKIFGSVDPATCLYSFEFGKDGKPLYVSGPNQTEADTQKIINRLSERLGPDGFHYLVGMEVGEDLDEE